VNTGARAAIAVLSFAASRMLFGIPPSGYVQDYRDASKELTILTTSAGSFRAGMTLYLYNQRQAIGTARVVRPFHSKVMAIVLTGAGFRKYNIAVADPSHLDGILGEQTGRVSFKDIGARVRSWIAQITYSAPPAETQNRKLDLPLQLGVRIANANYYTPIDSLQVKSLEFEWDGKFYKGKSCTLKDGTALATDEILAMGMNRLKPPLRDKPQSANVVLIEPKEQLQRIREDIPINISISDTLSALGKGKAYYLKVYSNSVFITEYLLGGNSLPAKIENRFAIPGIELAPGENRLDFYVVEAEFITDDYFEKGETKSIGTRTLDYGVNAEAQEIKIGGSNSLGLQ